jgi:hypothetical protein
LLVAGVVGAATFSFLNAGKRLSAGDSNGGGWQQTEPGISYRNDRVRNVPWSIHLVRIDRSVKDFTFFAAHAGDKILGVSRISDQARGVPRELGRPVAGVNGDFYERDNRTYAGDPRGLQIVRGELVSEPDTVCVYFDRDGAPHVEQVQGNFQIKWPNGKQTPFGLNRQRMPSRAVLYTPTYGPSTRVSGGRDLILEREASTGSWLPLEPGRTYRARVREVKDSMDTHLPGDAMVLSIGPIQASKVPEVEAGAVLEISTATTPDLTGVRTAIAGGPSLFEGGKPFSTTAPPPGSAGAYSERSKYERHPRSGIGWNDTHIYLLTVDGRQSDLSVGMTIAEMANYLSKLGCTAGMNFDGGVSATMWLSGRVANDPCQGERSIANSLFVLRKPAK